MTTEPVCAPVRAESPDLVTLDDVIGCTFCLSDLHKAAPKAPRPDSIPSLGFTEAGHVVDLPRTKRESQLDPIRYVTGIGWSEWYEATEADHKYVRNPEGKPLKPTRAEVRDRQCLEASS